MTTGTEPVNVAVRIVARWIWPLVLIARLTAYALTDSPTHIVYWHATRIQHASVYFAACALVAVAIGRTPWRILVGKCMIVSAVCVASVMGDVVVGTAREWLSVTSWATILVANWLVVLFRLTWIDERGRA